jgi:hypothetical protein
MSIFRDLAASFVDAGYTPLPISNRKSPGFVDALGNAVPVSHWRDADIRTEHGRSMVRDWQKRVADAGIGLLLGQPSGGIVGVDIDTEDKKIIDAIMATLPARTIKKRGKKGLTAFYRVPGEQKKVVWYAWDDDSQTHHKICELLADGQQTVLPPTIHPETGKPYEYLSRFSFPDATLQSLPMLPDGWFDTMDALFPDSARLRAEREHERSVTNPDSVYGQLNRKALENLDLWVPTIVQGATKQGNTYRAPAYLVRSGSGGDPTSLKLSPEGICDFGDENRGYTPLDLVMAAYGCDVDVAYRWMDEAIDPEGFEARKRHDEQFIANIKERQAREKREHAERVQETLELAATERARRQAEAEAEYAARVEAQQVSSAAGEKSVGDLSYEEQVQLEAYYTAHPEELDEAPGCFRFIYSPDPRYVNRMEIREPAAGTDLAAEYVSVCQRAEGSVKTIMDVLLSAHDVPDYPIAMSMTLSILSHAMARFWYTSPGGEKRTFANLVTIALSNSGEGKTTSYEKIKKGFLSAARRALDETEWVTFLQGSFREGGVKSETGLFATLEKNPVLLWWQDECSGMFSDVFSANAPAHRAALADTLKLSNNVRDIQKPASVAGGYGDIKQSSMSFLGASTVEKFWKAIPEDSYDDGFLGRCLIAENPRIVGGAEARAAALRPRIEISSEAIADELERLFLARRDLLRPADGASTHSCLYGPVPGAEDASQHYRFVRLSPQANELFQFARGECAFRKGDDAERRLPSSALWARAAEVALRVALIHALGRKDQNLVDPVIEDRDIRWGFDLVFACLAGVKERICAPTGRGIDVRIDKARDTVLRRLRKAQQDGRPVVSWSRVVGGGIDPRVLQGLVDEGIVALHPPGQGGGRGSVSLVA